MNEFRRKNTEAINAFLLKHKMFLQNLCARKTHGDVEEAKDLMQDIMLAAYIRRDEYDNNDSEQRQERWLVSIARSEIFKYKQWKRHRITLYPLKQGTDDAEEEMRTLLMDLARESLTSFETDLLKMRIDGYSYKEISLQSGIPEATLRKRLQRIIEKIRYCYTHNSKENE